MQDRLIRCPTELHSFKSCAGWREKQKTDWIRAHEDDEKVFCQFSVRETRLIILQRTVPKDLINRPRFSKHILKTQWAELLPAPYNLDRCDFFCSICLSPTCSSEKKKLEYTRFQSKSGAYAALGPSTRRNWNSASDTVVCRLWFCAPFIKWSSQVNCQTAVHLHAVFIRNQTWKTNSNQSCVAEAAAFKAGELTGLHSAGCLIVLSCFSKGLGPKFLLWLIHGLIITFK